MSGYIPTLEKLIEEFRRLPGIGRRSAERMAFRVLDFTDEQAESFADAIRAAKQTIGKCRVCGNICEGRDGICPICADERRDRSQICVVEDARALASLERVKEYHGTYHVLGGVISPMDGITPDKLNFHSLLGRIRDEGTEEVIIATNPTIEGETTAMYLSKLIKTLGVRTSRLAYGIPVGGELDHADEVTLSRAMEGRRDF